MTASGTSFSTSCNCMPRVTPRRLASYVQAETIPRSLPVMTALPRNCGFFATSHEAKKESPSMCNMARGNERERPHAPLTRKGLVASSWVFDAAEQSVLQQTFSDSSLYLSHLLATCTLRNTAAREEFDT